MARVIRLVPRDRAKTQMTCPGLAASQDVGKIILPSLREEKASAKLIIQETWGTRSWRNGSVMITERRTAMQRHILASMSATPSRYHPPGCRLCCAFGISKARYCTCYTVRS
jgi:hypothetical protein